MSGGNAVWQPIYEQSMHMQKLIAEIDFEVFDRARSDGDDDDLIDYGSLGVDLRREVNLKAVLTEFGSPLQRNTISDQYELVKEHVTIDGYSDAVKKHLGIMRGSSCWAISGTLIQTS